MSYDFILQPLINDCKKNKADMFNVKHYVFNNGKLTISLFNKQTREQVKLQLSYTVIENVMLVEMRLPTVETTFQVVLTDEVLHLLLDRVFKPCQ
jgi:hypothetical protein